MVAGREDHMSQIEYLLYTWMKMVASENIMYIS